MLKIVLHKAFSVSLALLVLFSTVSFTIEKHYCGDVLVDVSVFNEAKTCGMETQEMPQKKSCCKDEIDVVKGQDELKTVSLEDLDIEDQEFMPVFSINYFNGYISISKVTIPFNDYSPPNLVRDVLILDQVFLI